MICKIFVTFLNHILVSITSRIICDHRSCLNPAGEKTLQSGSLKISRGMGLSKGKYGIPRRMEEGLGEEGGGGVKPPKNSVGAAQSQLCGHFQPH